MSHKPNQFDKQTYLNGMSLTEHAKVRMAQRNVTFTDILFAVNNGERIHRQGRVYFTVRHKDIPPALRNGTIDRQLVGLTVVMDQRTPMVLTVYKDRESACRNLKRRTKRRRKPRRPIYFIPAAG
jgi:hypothetical protein